MGQTGVIFACLILAFVFYITTRGDLAKWVGILGI